MDFLAIAIFFIMPTFFIVCMAIDWLIYDFPHWWYHKKREWGL